MNKQVQDSGWQLTRVWLNALEETARDFYGTRPREFCMRAYEHATDYWIKIIDSELGIKTQKADSIKAAIQNYINSGIAGGLFGDASEFELEELPAGSVKIKVLNCPYKDSCKDLLERGFSLKSLTCARLGCFRAASYILADKECTYKLNEVNPGVMCSGLIELL